MNESVREASMYMSVQQAHNELQLVSKALWKEIEEVIQLYQPIFRDTFDATRDSPTENANSSHANNYLASNNPISTLDKETEPIAMHLIEQIVRETRSVGQIIDMMLDILNMQWQHTAARIRVSTSTEKETNDTISIVAYQLVSLYSDLQALALGCLIQCRFAKGVFSLSVEQLEIVQAYIKAYDAHESICQPAHHATQSGSPHEDTNEMYTTRYTRQREVNPVSIWAAVGTAAAWIQKRPVIAAGAIGTVAAVALGAYMISRVSSDNTSESSTRRFSQSTSSTNGSNHSHTSNHRSHISRGSPNSTGLTISISRQSGSGNSDGGEDTNMLSQIWSTVTRTANNVFSSTEQPNDDNRTNKSFFQTLQSAFRSPTPSVNASDVSGIAGDARRVSRTKLGIVRESIPPWIEPDENGVTFYRNVRAARLRMQQSNSTNAILKQRINPSAADALYYRSSKLAAAGGATAAATLMRRWIADRQGTPNRLHTITIRVLAAACAVYLHQQICMRHCYNDSSNHTSSASSANDDSDTLDASDAHVSDQGNMSHKSPANCTNIDQHDQSGNTTRADEATTAESNNQSGATSTTNYPVISELQLSTLQQFTATLQIALTTQRWYLAMIRHLGIIGKMLLTNTELEIYTSRNQLECVRQPVIWAVQSFDELVRIEPSNEDIPATGAVVGSMSTSPTHSANLLNETQQQTETAESLTNTSTTMASNILQEADKTFLQGSSYHTHLTSTTPNTTCCCICLSPMLPGELLVRSSRISCGAVHLFHRECLPDSFAARNGCPLCRAPIYQLDITTVASPFVLESTFGNTSKHDSPTAVITSPYRQNRSSINNEDHISAVLLSEYLFGSVGAKSDIGIRTDSSSTSPSLLSYSNYQIAPEQLVDDICCAISLLLGGSADVSNTNSSNSLKLEAEPSSIGYCLEWLCTTCMKDMDTCSYISHYISQMTDSVAFASQWPLMAPTPNILSASQSIQRMK